MLTIREIQQLNHGDRVNAELDVKTICSSKEHKRRQSPKTGEITQPVILTDNTGDILAYVFCPNNETIGRGWKMIIQGYINKENGLRIDVIFWRVETQTADEYLKDREQHYSQSELAENKGVDWDKIAARKVRCAILCAKIQAHRDIDKDEIRNLVEFVMFDK